MQAITSNIKIDMSSEYLILAPGNKDHKYTLIFLHGVDMSVQKFFNVFLSSSLIKLLEDTKIVIPQAPVRPIEIYKEREGHSWCRKDENSFNEAREKIKGIFEKELQDVDNDPSRIFVGGFSQGAVLALDLALTLDKKIGGVMIVGGFKAPYTVYSEEKEYSDIVIIHGDKDKIVTWEKAEESFKPVLDNENVKVVRVRDMEHNLTSEDAKQAMYEFIRERTQAV